MCGIYGTTIRYSDKVVSHKLGLMRFRGPDNVGFVREQLPDDGQLTMGHVRLSILDLDARSNQPFKFNDDIVIVFNGEIYNFEELKQTYCHGYSFKTSSDTEVICAMYEKYGFKSVEYFNGMFAFALYDRRKNIIWGVRDRLGKKPFYYRLLDQDIEFASQPSLLKYGNELEIDPLSRTFLLFGNYIPDPYCIYKGVRKLRAGDYFIYDLASRKFDVNKYWDIDYNSQGYSAPKSFDEAEETVKSLIYDSVKIRLKADVPVGVFLSGGVDSSIVSGYVSKINPKLSCYSIGFDDGKYDESNHAKEVAEAFGVPFKLSYCTGDELLKMFEGYTRYFDEPFSDDSLIPSSLVAMKAKQDVTVVLGGDGGDELFLGYPKFHKFKELEDLYSIPFLVRKYGAKTLSLLFHNSMINLLKFEHVEDAILSRSNVIDYHGAEKYSNVDIARQLPDREYLKKERGILKYSDFDMKHYLNSNGNTKTDRATMRFSLELRSPLMDFRLAEYSRLLPYEYLYDQENGCKKMLKSILYDMIDRDLVDRPKMGFSSPMVNWLRHELREKFIDTVTKENVEQMIPELESDKIIKERDRFLEGGFENYYSMWVVFNYVTWYNENYLKI